MQQRDLMSCLLDIAPPLMLAEGYVDGMLSNAVFQRRAGAGAGT
jgi:hypothetical protein